MTTIKDQLAAALKGFVIEYDLKPCPFCGVIPVIEKTVDRERPWFGVVCRSMGKNVGGTCAIESRPIASIESAVQRWNTRAGNADELVKALEKSHGQLKRLLDNNVIYEIEDEHEIDNILAEHQKGGK